MLDTNPPELAHMSMLFENISAADHDLSLRLLEHSSKRIALLLSGDPVRRWNDMFGLLFHVLGYAAISFGDKDNLPTKCRPAARVLVRELDREKIALALAGPQDLWGQMNFDSFIGLIERSDPPTFAAIAERINFTMLE